MLRFFFASLVLLHGLIHLMGFAKAFKYAELNQLQTPISRSAGIFWLLSAVLFALATALFFLKKETWWMLALLAVLVSQLLIVQSWQDSKYGTIANLLILLGIILAWGSWNFNKGLEKEMRLFMPAASASANRVLSTEMLAELPPIVRRWLERSGAMGKPPAQVLQIEQTGRMRTSPDGNWMPFEARQFVRTAAPGFFWTVDVQAAPGVHLVGRDKYENGKGYMLIKALALWTIADARGPETDQGALLRYLGELAWHPGSALASYIDWESTDDSLAARATMRYGGIVASGLFHFSAEGDIESFEALRYYNRKTGATQEKWKVEMVPDSFRELGGVRIPARSKVSWLLETGAFNWLELEIKQLKYLK